MTIQLYETRQILFKVESTAGVDSAPVGGTDAMLSFSGTVAVAADRLDRKPDRPYFGADPFLLVKKRAEVSFDLELIGAAAIGTASPIGPVLKACGMSETLNAGVSTIYAPVSSGFTSGTLYFFIGPLRYTMVYSMGTLDITQEIKSYNRAKAKFTGVITNTTMPTEASVGAVTITAFQAPPATEAENWTVGMTFPGAATIAAPVTSACTLGAGTLPAATYYYNVCATNANGSSLPGTEQSQVCTINTGANVNFAAVVGSTGFDIFRATVAGQKGTFLVHVGLVTTYLDNGSIAVSAGPPVPTRNSTGDTPLQTKKLMVSLNNDVKIHEASQVRSVAIMQRKPSGTITYLEPLLSAFNPWAIANNYNLQNIVSVVGIVPGKICTIIMPLSQLEYTKITPIDAAICFETPFSPLPSTAGNDEFSIKFT